MHTMANFHQKSRVTMNTEPCWLERGSHRSWPPSHRIFISRRYGLGFSIQLGLSCEKSAEGSEFSKALQEMRTYFTDFFFATKKAWLLKEAGQHGNSVFCWGRSMESRSCLFTPSRLKKKIFPKTKDRFFYPLLTTSQTC